MEFYVNYIITVGRGGSSHIEITWNVGGTFHVFRVHISHVHMGNTYHRQHLERGGPFRKKKMFAKLLTEGSLTLKTGWN